jgi:HNH endonuclease
MAAKSNSDVLNTLVRVLLLKTATKPAPASYQLQSATDVKRYFDFLCAYCAGRAPVEFDHAIPTNQYHLGEHYKGNLIPSCRECNDTKKKGHPKWGLDYRQFLTGKEGGADRITKIEAWMKADGYVPLGDDPEIKALVESVRADVAKSLEKCVAEIRLRRR